MRQALKLREDKKQTINDTQLKDTKQTINDTHLKDTKQTIKDTQLNDKAQGRAHFISELRMDSQQRKIFVWS